MIKVADNKCTFNKSQNADFLEACLDSCLETTWKDCTPKELLEKTLHDFGLNLKIEKGSGNTQEPNFIISLDKTVILYVSNEHTVCGEKQILYFFLKYVVTGEIKEYNNRFLFTFSNNGAIVSCVQESANKYEMTENPGLNENSETLLRILRSR